MDPTVDNYYASNGKVPSRLRLVVVSSGSCRRSEVEAGASPSWWREEEDPPAPAWPWLQGAGLRPPRPAAASAHRCAAVVSPLAVVSAPPSVSAGPREVGRLPLRLSAVSARRHRHSVAAPPEGVVALRDLVVVLLLAAPRRHGPRGPSAAAAARRCSLWCRIARLPPPVVLPSGAAACSPLLRPLLRLAWWCEARAARVRCCCFRCRRRGCRDQWWCFSARRRRLRPQRRGARGPLLRGWQPLFLRSGGQQRQARGHRHGQQCVVSGAGHQTRRILRVPEAIRQ